MKSFLFISFLVFFHYCMGQATLVPLLEEMPSDTLMLRSIEVHPSIRPALTNSPHTEQRFKKTDSLQPKKMILGAVPLFDGAIRSYESQYRALVGFGLNMNYQNNWYGNFNYLQGFENATDRFALQTVSTVQKNNNLSEKLDLRGRLSYSPSKFVNLQAGFDENFIGEGARSLFLSDYGKPYAFGQARLNFWRVEYLVLYQQLNERLGNQKVQKYSTTHYLNFSASDWLQFGLFETVVFAPKDTLLYRGFEPEYLNPMIFFRPQEYALGSSDNVIVGFDLAATYKKWTFYSQLLLDEFSLTELRAKTKWWANKFGIQTGIKGRISVLNKPLFLRTEINFVRPYTYSHLSIAQSYTNRGNVMAHPLQANFIELLIEAKYRYKRWIGEFFINYSLKGYNDSFNRGGNIFTPYFNRPDDYGHTVGQGNHDNQFLLSTKLSYRLFKRLNFWSFVEYQGRTNTYLDFLPNNTVILGIRCQAWNDYRNY